jgi:hypothetical protein
LIIELNTEAGRFQVRRSNTTDKHGEDNTANENVDETMSLTATE